MDKTWLINRLRMQEFSEIIIDSFKNVPREDFVSDKYKDYAYNDTALPLDIGSTISQPSTIAFMLKLLELEKMNLKKDNKGKKKSMKILEIGSGCGYVIALINKIIDAKIYGIEINKRIAKKSINYFSNHSNIHIISKDGKNGMPKKAPFDRIIISATCENIPHHLLDQLTNDGILVTPVNDSIYQLRKINDKIIEKQFPGFLFVPLI